MSKTGANTAKKNNLATDFITPAGLLGSVIKAEPIGLNFANATTSGNITDATAYFIAVYLPVSATITGVKFTQGIQGAYTADSNNYIALYSVSGGTLTQVAISTNNGNVWKGTSGTTQTVSFVSTYAAAAGVYYIAILYNSSAQTTAPALQACISQNGAPDPLDFTNSAKLAGTIAAQSSLPSPTQALSGISNTSLRLYLALY